MVRPAAIAVLALCAGLVHAARPIDTQTGMIAQDTETLTADFAVAQPEQAFDLWLSRYGKDYKDDVRQKAERLPVFRANAVRVAQHNANAGASFRMALNEFADLTYDEFAATRLGLNPSAGGSLRRRAPAGAAPSPFSYANASLAELPSKVDWREKGAVTEVKNQAACGSCWAFSTTGAIEGINAIKTGELVSLSEQQLVSCDREKDMGCGGGLMDFAFEYVVKNGGIDTEADYGYWSFDLPCQRRRESDRTAVTIDGYEDVPVNDGDALKKAVAHQPVAVAICASPALQFYASGVVDDRSCCTELNHGVLAVGYADMDDDDAADGHWIVKNSWGGGWGEDGYFRLSRASANPEGACGIYQVASFPVKSDASNPEVPEICGLFGWTECPLRASCVCDFSFFGLFCFSWGCQAGGPPQTSAAATPAS